MLQIFVAVMARAFPDYYGVQMELILLENISSYMLMACGVVYLVSVRQWKAQIFNSGDLDSCALAISNVFDNGKRFRGIKQLRIWRLQVEIFEPDIDDPTLCLGFQMEGRANNNELGDLIWLSKTNFLL
ncbi:hypothetical protein RGQ29_001379 [Quercus rubra]|uniref:Uncharacterized protein n=1 Tax=Quercus rubra TaxID=3512 RepID=A0AAN7J6Z2_QUERU|nr:hypothetical protein RGQ29_001379 [Quercus rubra]